MQTLKRAVLNDVLSKPDGFDRKGPYWRKETVRDNLINLINTDNRWINQKAIDMTEQVNDATEIVNEAIAMFEKSTTRLAQKESELAEVSRKVSGNVRSAANDLANGLLKIEKTADFTRLERYVELLERASVAISALAELEKNGKLERIAAAIK